MMARSAEGCGRAYMARVEALDIRVGDEGDRVWRRDVRAMKAPMPGRTGVSREAFLTVR